MTLLCPVRDCHRPLARQAEHLLCEQGHTFDVARSGYVNLLQPQDRRSKNPGDSKEAAVARRRLHDQGITLPLSDAIAKLLALSSRDVVLDAGCGDGFYLHQVAGQAGSKSCGIDISVPAIDLAARRYKDVEWIVANADRFIPFPDGYFSVVLSITARMNVEEFWRVLGKDGRLLIAVPAPEDLIELRGTGRDRVERTVEEFSSRFKLIAQNRATTTADLDAAGVEDVQRSIYRPMHRKPAEAARVTFSLDLLLFAPSA